MSAGSESLVPLYGTVYGPLYFSTLMSTALYGITCMQTFFYYVHYQNDPRRMKCYVAVVWAFDTIHEALTIAGVYKYIMAGLVNPSAMLDGIPIPEFNLLILSAAFVSMPTQAFFVHRFYIFSGKNLVAPLFWGVQAIYQFVAAILYEAKAFYSADGRIRAVGMTELADGFFTGLVISSLALAAAVDVLIAIALTYLLAHTRNASTGFANTAHILQRLTIFAVNTGIWTATFAVLAVILLHVFPTNLLYVVPTIPLSSLYCNTLLANLNARSYIRGEATTHGPNTDLVMFLPGPGDEDQGKKAKPMSSTHLNAGKTTEVVTFRNADRSATPENSV